MRKQLVQPAGGFGGQRGQPRVFKQVRRRWPALFHLTPSDAGKFLTERTIGIGASLTLERPYRDYAQYLKFTKKV